MSTTCSGLENLARHAAVQAARVTPDTRVHAAGRRCPFFSIQLPISASDCAFWAAFNDGNLKELGGNGRACSDCHSCRPAVNARVTDAVRTALLVHSRCRYSYLASTAFSHAGPVFD